MNIYKDAISTIYQENIDNCINNLKMSQVFDRGPEMLDQRGVRRPKTQQQTRLEVRTPDLTQLPLNQFETDTVENYPDKINMNLEVEKVMDKQTANRLYETFRNEESEREASQIGHIIGSKLYNAQG